VVPNSVSAGLSGLVFRFGEEGWLLVFCSTGSCSCERKPGLRRGRWSREEEVTGRLGMCEARCDTRASQLPLCELVWAGRSPYAASKVRLLEAMKKWPQACAVPAPVVSRRAGEGAARLSRSICRRRALCYIGVCRLSRDTHTHTHQPREKTFETLKCVRFRDTPTTMGDRSQTSRIQTVFRQALDRQMGRPTTNHAAS
jgi:hypothetical protein